MSKWPWTWFSTYNNSKYARIVVLTLVLNNFFLVKKVEVFQKKIFEDQDEELSCSCRIFVGCGSIFQINTCRWIKIDKYCWNPKKWLFRKNTIFNFWKKPRQTIPFLPNLKFSHQKVCSCHTESCSAGEGAPCYPPLVTSDGVSKWGFRKFDLVGSKKF